MYIYDLHGSLSAIQGLEYCEERYSQELSGSGFPLRAQTTNTRLLSCQTIEKLRPHPDRDDSMNEGKAAAREGTDERKSETGTALVRLFVVKRKLSEQLFRVVL